MSAFAVGRFPESLTLERGDPPSFWQQVHVCPVAVQAHKPDISVAISFSDTVELITVSAHAAR